MDPLRAALTRFPSADALEAAHRDAMLALAAAGEPALRRDHWDPGHFTASAFVLSPERDALLLIFHGKLDRWLQPGGHLEPGDADPLTAARREVGEETGLGEIELLDAGLAPSALSGFAAPFFDLDVHLIPARKADPAHRHFDLRFLFRARSRHIAAGDDAVAARWVPLEEVSTVGTDESVLRAWRKLRAAGA